MGFFLDPINIGQQIFHGIEFLNQFQRPFRTYSFNARNVIDAVAHDAEDFDNVVGLDSPFVLDRLFVVNEIIPHGI